MTVFDTVSSTASSIFAAIAAYADTHHDGLIALSLFAGVIITFAGRTLLKPTVFLLGFVPSTVTIIALGFAFVHDENPGHTSLLEAAAVIVGVMIGVLVGVIMLRLLFRIATFLLCAGFGAVLVFVFYLFLLEPIGGGNALFVVYSLALLAALISGLFSVSYPETGIILGTSFDGSALAVYSLAHFLGHQPTFVKATDEVQTSMWWSMGYGAATLILGVFGFISQRQVATADAIIATNTERKRQSANMDPMAQYQSFPGEGDHLLPMIEPPHTPLHMRSGVESPAAGSGYGAIEDDPKYSVAHNLGAGPLSASGDLFPSSKKDSNGSHPL